MPRRAVGRHQVRFVWDRVARPVVASVDGISQVTGDFLVASHPHLLSLVDHNTSGCIDVSTRACHTQRSRRYVRMYRRGVGTKVPPPGWTPDGGDRIPPERGAFRCSRPLPRMSGGHTTAGTGLGVRGACAAGRAHTGGGRPRPTPTGESTQRRRDRNRERAAAPAPTEPRGGNPVPSVGDSSHFPL